MNESHDSDYKPKILVAEDEPFQRLLLVDFLEDIFTVTAAENGKIALNKLLEENASYDLVLLDLQMPEMDGLELLIYMQEHKQLKNIPVVMMSADNENESVAACMKNGAKNYFVKPVRAQTLKTLWKYIDKISRAPISNSLAQYELIEDLGVGAGGSAHLIKNKNDGQEYALKKISLKMKDQREKRLAENEYNLLKVLDVPTITHYYNHFIEDDTIYIIMEYAEGGCLGKKLQERKKLEECRKLEERKKLEEQKVTEIHFTNDEILDWIAQLTLGMAHMHLKNILHRDIKPDNIFLSKKNVAKLGDFGVSKALSSSQSLAGTFTGTPYYMSPEVSNHEPYNKKSDVWSLGCSIYELASLKRPFDHDDLQGLFRCIRDKEVDPLPEHVDPKISMLIYSMLQKDPKARPSIWDIAKIEFIRERIHKFVRENNCEDTLNNLVDPKPVEDDSSTNVWKFPKNRLDEVAQAMRNSIKLRMVSHGIFAKYQNVVTGEDLYKWFNDHFELIDQKQIGYIIHEMIQQELLHSPNDAKEWQNSSKVLYRFQVDKPGIAANMIKVFKGHARQGLEVSKELVRKMNDLLTEVRDKSQPEIHAIDKNKLKVARNFIELQKATAELQAIQLTSLHQDEKIACLLNIHQIMFIHKMLRDKLSGEEFEGFIKRMRSFISLHNVPFYYVVSQMQFTLEDLKHGILRGNKKAPGSIIYNKQFNENDMRNNLIRINDLRVLVFVMQLESGTLGKLEAFDPSTLNEQLNKHCKQYLNDDIFYDVNENELKVPTAMQNYVSDFGGQDALLKFITQYNHIMQKQLQQSDLDSADRPNSLSVIYTDEQC